MMIGKLKRHFNHYCDSKLIILYCSRGQSESKIPIRGEHPTLETPFPEATIFQWSQPPICHNPSKRATLIRAGVQSGASP